MKKFLALFLIMCILSGCAAKKETADASVGSILNEMKKEVAFHDPEEEDITEKEFAEKYGLAMSDVEEGKAYYTKDIENVDMIMVVKAKNTEAVRSIEKALEGEIQQLDNVWAKEKEEEHKKIQNHVQKTNGRYVTLIISDKAKELEKIFDNSLSVS